MSDLFWILKALAWSALSAGVVFLLYCLPWRNCPADRAARSAVLGPAIGFYLGCWLLERWPRWPPREDQDRLLIFLLPVVIGIELVAAFPAVCWRWPWLLRLIVAVSVAPILLHQTTYLSDVAGAGSCEWTPVQIVSILGCLTVALTLVWILLILLARRMPTQLLPLGMALTCVAAGVTVMLSGYATGGQLGLLLGAALIGTVGASLFVPLFPDVHGSCGLGIVGLFCLLIMGRFFGTLSTLQAILLFAAPLLGWVAEIPYFQRRRPWLRGLVQLVLVTLLLTGVVLQALAWRHEEAFF